MTSSPAEALEQRIQSLEAKCKGLRRAMCAVVALLVGVVMLGASTSGGASKVVSAQAFNLVDANGGRIAAFSQTKDQRPGLWFYPSGKEAVVMVQTESGDAMFYGGLTCSGSGKQSLTVGKATDDSMGVWYTNEKGTESQVLWSDGKRYELWGAGSAGGGMISGDDR
jgi:hypothetical protein